jgi:putative ABC transport system substrate-binding protein
MLGLAWTVLLAAALWAWPAAPAFPAPDSAPVAVLYPDVREPYRAVFTNIVHGIEEGLDGPPSLHALGEGDDIQALGAQLAKNRVKAVIALGRIGLVAARKFPREMPVIVGAVLAPVTPGAPEFTGIALTPDPNALFDWLRNLAPEAKQVTVIYNPERDEWSIALAREAARQQGLALNALPTRNLREAAAQYRDFLSRAREGEALWLPQDDSILDENTLLPVILKEAWDKNLVVFSSNPEHVKRGALFSLYPDNRGLGRSLAELTLERLKGQPKPPAILALKALLIAVNARTAEHLGLRLTNQARRRFDLVFPSP